MASNTKPEPANDAAGEERGGAGERGNAEHTAFVSNLPFNITMEDLREKFKHVRTLSPFYFYYHDLIQHVKGYFGTLTK